MKRSDFLKKSFGLLGAATFLPKLVEGNGNEPNNCKVTSLLITQIAFPKNVCDNIYAQGAYAAKGLNYTKNTDDKILSDSLSEEMANVMGDLEKGFLVSHAIKVKA